MLSLNFQFRIAQVAAAILMGFSVGSFAQTEAGISLPGCGDCERVARISQAGRDMLAMAEQGNTEVRQPAGAREDGRMTAEQFLAKSAEYDPKFVEAMKAAINSTVAIVEVRNREGNLIDDPGYFGSGFVVFNRCYVATSRHVVNDQMLTTKLGSQEKIMVPDGSKDPTGYKVKLSRKSDGGNETLMGTVIKSWASPNMTHEDVVLIRLNARANVPKIMGFRIDDLETIASSDIATASYPSDWQPGRNAETVVVQTCRLDAKKSKSGSLETNCKDASGGSGGPVIGRVFNSDKQDFEYGFVGIGSMVDGEALVRTPSGNTADYGRLTATDSRAFAIEMQDIVKAHLKENPCK